jgi:hypothetical protein
VCLPVLLPSSCAMSSCRGSRPCVACSVSFFLCHILLSGLQSVCCLFCFLLLVAYLAVGAAEHVLPLLFSSYYFMSCFRHPRPCVARSLSSFLLHILLSGLQGLCCVFCFLPPVACLPVGAAWRALHILFPFPYGMSCCRTTEHVSHILSPSSCGMYCSMVSRVCVARSVYFILRQYLFPGLQFGLHVLFPSSCGMFSLGTAGRITCSVSYFLWHVLLSGLLGVLLVLLSFLWHVLR